MSNTRLVLLCLALVATTLTQAPIEILKQNDKGYVKFQNDEFLLTGGIHMPNDKTWCLHQAVYRQPVTSTADSYSQGRSLQRVAGERETGKVNESAAISAFSDFLCSNNHLSFTDHTVVCNTMSQKLAVKYRAFFTNEQFRRKAANAINQKFIELRQIRKHPRSTAAMQEDEFLKVCDAQINTAMTDLVFTNLDNDIVGVSSSNGMTLTVVEYVMLNVEDLFIQDKVAAKDAWQHAYPSFKSKTNGAVFSDFSVRYFIEAIRLRYKPRTDIPTPNEERLGNPLFVPLTPFETPKPDYPNYSEDIPKQEKKRPSFLINESPKFKSDSFQPETIEGKAPATPNTSDPKSQTPGEIHETNDSPNIAEPEEKPTTEEEKIEGGEQDKTTRVEIIEVDRQFNIHKALFSYDSLTESMKKDVRTCGLSLAPAMKRCESVHGTANCQAITPTYVGPKCAQGFVREGCCTCVSECPSGFRSNKLVCSKPKSYFTSPRPTENGCFLANAVKCEKVGEVYSAPCKAGFRRVGTALCVAACPEGTTDFGNSCLRKTIKMGSIFTWTSGDE